RFGTVRFTFDANCVQPWRLLPPAGPTPGSGAATGCSILYLPPPIEMAPWGMKQEAARRAGAEGATRPIGPARAFGCTVAVQASQPVRRPSASGRARSAPRRAGGTASQGEKVSQRREVGSGVDGTQRAGAGALHRARSVDGG